MPRHILTGAPGSGKTTIIRQLEIEGYVVVEEAATDIIHLENAYGNSAPWEDIEFIEKIARLQIQRRQHYIDYPEQHQFFDRSPFCTHALAIYLGVNSPKALLDEMNYVKENKIYQDTIFFIENLGQIQRTEARKISFEEALRFEKIHREVYLNHGFKLIAITNNSIKNRADNIIQSLQWNIF